MVAFHQRINRQPTIAGESVFRKMNLLDTGRDEGVEGRGGGRRDNGDVVDKSRGGSRKKLRSVVFPVDAQKKESGR